MKVKWHNQDRYLSLLAVTMLSLFDTPASNLNRRIRSVDGLISGQKHMQENTGLLVRKGFLDYGPRDNNKLSSAIMGALEPTIHFVRAHA